MTLERDKFLTEAMGECWHEGANNYGEIVCQRCHRLVMEEDRLDFSNWAGFGKLWEWAQKQEWFREFYYEFFAYPPNADCTVSRWVASRIEPNCFANELYGFLKRIQQ